MSQPPAFASQVEPRAFLQKILEYRPASLNVHSWKSQDVREWKLWFRVDQADGEPLAFCTMIASDSGEDLPRVFAQFIQCDIVPFPEELVRNPTTS